MAVIELGDFSSRPSGPAPASWRSALGPSSVRRLGASGIALACLLLLGASARPGTPLVHDVWSTVITSEDARTVRADGVYVHRTISGRGELTAYDVATGAPRWTHVTEGRVSGIYPGELAGVLLVSGDEKYANVEFQEGSQVQIGYGGTTVALDARTGRPLWETPGEIQSAGPDTVLLAERSPRDEYSTMRLIRTRTGAAVWRRLIPGIRHLIVPDANMDPARIILADANGAITVVRHADGSPIVNRRVPWSAPQFSAGIDTGLSEVSGVLLVSRNGPAEITHTAYRVDSLQPLWETKTELASYFQGCGRVLCLSEDRMFHGIDPLTGRRVWSLNGRSNITPLRHDRVLVAANGADPPIQALIDPATGEQLGTPAAGWAFPPYQAAASVVTMRPVTGDGQPRSAISHLDLMTGRVSTVGSVEFPDAVTARCDHIPGYLVCQRGERLVVTAVP